LPTDPIKAQKQQIHKSKTQINQLKAKSTTKAKRQPKKNDQVITKKPPPTHFFHLKLTEKILC
jgi:hypothetical protein